MGLHDEFVRGAEQLVLDVDKDVNLFETTIRIGGLLSAYALSKRPIS